MPLLQRVDTKDVPVRHLVQLPINYRSTEQIVSMSQRVIVKDPTRVRKPISAAKSGGSSVSLVGCDTDLEQYQLIVKHIANNNVSNCAILCRMRYMLKPVVAEIEKIGLPYRLMDGKGFYELPEVEFVLNHLRSQLVNGKIASSGNVTDAVKFAISHHRSKKPNNNGDHNGDLNLNKLIDMATDCTTLYQLFQLVANVEESSIPENVSKCNKLFKTKWGSIIYQLFCVYVTGSHCSYCTCRKRVGMDKCVHSTVQRGSIPERQI